MLTIENLNILNEDKVDLEYNELSGEEDEERKKL